MQISNGRFLSAHAARRMAERAVKLEDVEAVLAGGVVAQAGNARFYRLSHSTLTGVSRRAARRLAQLVVIVSADAPGRIMTVCKPDNPWAWIEARK